MIQKAKLQGLICRGGNLNSGRTLSLPWVVESKPRTPHTCTHSRATKQCTWNLPKPFCPHLHGADPREHTFFLP